MTLQPISGAIAVALARIGPSCLRHRTGGCMGVRSSIARPDLRNLRRLSRQRTSSLVPRSLPLVIRSLLLQHTSFSRSGSVNETTTTTTTTHSRDSSFAVTPSFAGASRCLDDRSLSPQLAAKNPSHGLVSSDDSPAISASIVFFCRW